MNDFLKYLDENLKYCLSFSQKALKNEGGVFSSCPLEYEKLRKVIGDDEELVEAFLLIINEILLQQMHALLVAMDGGAWISEKYRFDIVDKEDESNIINEEVALHEEFFDYLWEERDGDPFRLL